MRDRSSMSVLIRLVLTVLAIVVIVTWILLGTGAMLPPVEGP